MSISPQTHLNYRPIEESHIQQLMGIELEAYPEPWTVGMFRDEIKNPHSHFHIAYEHELLVGYCGFWLLVDDAHITSITVAKPHRGKGFGRAQLEHLTLEARRLGAVKLSLEVRESNQNAIDLYTTSGFIRVGCRKGYYSRTGEDAVLMDYYFEDSQPDQNEM
jgi:ribosomal-protein-alanine N-acetyltransferase